MKEIRPIHNNETHEFLKLLCEVFNLNFHRAHDIFYTEPFFDITNKWALIENNKLLSIATITPLEFGFGPAFGIAGVATRPELRHKGLATELLQELLRVAGQSNKGPSLLFAEDTKLYETLGFHILDTVIHATLATVPKQEELRLIPFSDIQNHYTQWAHQHPLRLRRDSRRWQYWLLRCKKCINYNNGYICIEENTVREALIDHTATPLPLENHLSWLGLNHLTKKLGLPLINPKIEMYLMGNQFDQCPQMFMSDQF